MISRCRPVHFDASSATRRERGEGRDATPRDATRRRRDDDHGKKCALASTSIHVNEQRQPRQHNRTTECYSNKLTTRPDTPRARARAAADIFARQLEDANNGRSDRPRELRGGHLADSHAPVKRQSRFPGCASARRCASFYPAVRAHGSA